jgi:hypothetical protein
VLPPPRVPFSSVLSRKEPSSPTLSLKGNENSGTLLFDKHWNLSSQSSPPQKAALAEGTDIRYSVFSVKVMDFREIES